MIRVMFYVLVIGCAVECCIEASSGDGWRTLAMGAATVLLVLLRGELTDRNG